VAPLFVISAVITASEACYTEPKCILLSVITVVNDCRVLTKHPAVAKVGRPYRTAYIRRPAPDFRSWNESDFPEWP